MKPATEWLNEIDEVVMSSAFDNPLGTEVEKLVKRIQDDARKDGLMTAQCIASDVINRESPKYARPEDRPPAQFALSGLNFYVCSAITAEADKLEYSPRGEPEVRP